MIVGHWKLICAKMGTLPVQTRHTQRHAQPDLAESGRPLDSVSLARDLEIIIESLTAISNVLQGSAESVTSFLALLSF